MNRRRGGSKHEQESGAGKEAAEREGSGTKARAAAAASRHGRLHSMPTASREGSLGQHMVLVHQSHTARSVVVACFGLRPRVLGRRWPELLAHRPLHVPLL